MNNTPSGLACRLYPSPTSSLLLRTLYPPSLPYAGPRMPSGGVTRKGVALTHLQSFVDQDAGVSYRSVIGKQTGGIDRPLVPLFVTALCMVFVTV
jgi:hypothetical protein